MRGLSLSVGPEPVVLTGANGSGKTNLLEAVSLLASGQGLRRAPYPELARMGAPAGRSRRACSTPLGPVDIGTGLAEPDDRAGTRAGRIVRIDGEDQSGSGALADHVEMVWLTPAMDGLFTGPGLRAPPLPRPADRRASIRATAPCLGQFERAMQQRNRLLADDVRDAARFAGLRARSWPRPASPSPPRAPRPSPSSRPPSARAATPAPAALFPWAELALAGTLETDLATRPAVDVEDDYVATLRRRARARPGRRPHARRPAPLRPDRRPRPQGDAGQGVLHGRAEGAADRPGAGALPISSRQRRDGAAPILLLDEIAAHLDPLRRAALFEEIVALGSQAWMSGTDPEAFAALGERAQFLPRRGGPRSRRLADAARRRLTHASSY